MMTERDRARRGLKKLMLRLPALRSELQIISAHQSALESLCGAFEDASTTLDSLRLAGAGANQVLLREYEQICAELEEDVIEICLRER